MVKIDLTKKLGAETSDFREKEKDLGAMTLGELDKLRVMYPRIIEMIESHGMGFWGSYGENSYPIKVE